MVNGYVVFLCAPLLPVSDLFCHIVAVPYKQYQIIFILHRGNKSLHRCQFHQCSEKCKKNEIGSYILSRKAAHLFKSSQSPERTVYKLSCTS
jgi:hypothetical protein